MGGLQVVTVCLLFSLAAGWNTRELFYGGGKDGYIIGGEESEKGRWPFMAVLERGTPSLPSSYSLTCGASLISPTYALCAAHCLFFFSDPREFRVRLGAHQLSANDEEAIIYAKTIIRHPDFLFGLSDPDIAVIELEEEVDLSNQYISIVPLPNDGQEFAGNENCYITGWGRTDPADPSSTSDVLNELHVTVHTTEECVKIYEESNFSELAEFINDDQVCVAGPDDGACHGDSGGPMQCDVTGNGDYVQAGITSWGTGDSCQGAASVYTKVASHLDWIREHVPDLP